MSDKNSEEAQNLTIQEAISYVPNFVEEFPINPIIGDVYLTPIMPARGSEDWNDLTKEEQTVQDLRRIGVLRGTINASAIGYQNLVDERNEARADAQIQREENLESSRLMLTDELTGLENRRALNWHIDSMTPEQKHTAVAAFIDLDKFKAVNEINGHAVGDKVLQSVADALREFKFREDDRVFRLAGDEFVVILKDAKGLEDAELEDGMVPRGQSSPEKITSGFTKRLQAAISNRIEQNTRLRVHASIGIEVPKGDITIEDSIKEADKKMFEAKRRADPMLRHKVSKITKGLIRGR